MRNQSPLRKTGKNIKCAVCNKEFYAPFCRLKDGRKFCSHKCMYVGRMSNNYKNGKYENCPICNNKFYTTPCRIHRKYCSRLCYLKVPVTKETREKCSNAHKGSKSYMWRGGVTPEGIKRLTTMEWKAIRKSVYERDNRICQRCSKKCSYLNIQCHHIRPYRVSQDNTLNNLVTLCKVCHGIIDFEYKKLELFDKQQ